MSQLSFLTDEFVDDEHDSYTDDQNNHSTHQNNNSSLEAIDIIQDYENKIKNFRNDISEQSKDILQLEDINLELKREKDEVVQQSKIERDKLLTRIELYECDKEDLSKAVEKAKLNIETLQNDIRHLQKENLELQQEIIEKCAEIEVLESQTQELLQMEKSLFEMKEDHSIEHQDSIGHLSHRPSLENGNESGESLFHEIYEATKQSEFNSTLSDLQAELSAAQVENYRLQNEKLDIETQIIDLKDELDAKKNETEVLRAQLVDTKKQLETKVTPKAQTAFSTLVSVQKPKPITVTACVGTCVSTTEKSVQTLPEDSPQHECPTSLSSRLFWILIAVVLFMLVLFSVTNFFNFENTYVDLDDILCHILTRSWVSRSHSLSVPI